MPKKAPRQEEQLSLEMGRVKNCPFCQSEIAARQVFRPQMPYQPDYIRKSGVLFTQDSLPWLESLQDSSVDLVFADPPYNVRKADWMQSAGDAEGVRETGTLDILDYYITGDSAPIGRFGYAYGK